MKKSLLFLCILSGYLLNAQSFSNGNLSTGNTSSGSVAAPTGYTWSEIQSSNSSYGFAGYIGTNSSNFRLADDFTVPADESWAISSIEVFAYQTGSTTFPIDQMNLRILSGNPSTAPTILFGDAVTNILNTAGSVDALMYRIATTPDTNRRIWKLKADVNTVLNPGTYWIDYQLHAINNGSLFLPPVTNLGVTAPAGANAQQFNETWAPIIDTGSGSMQEMPFIITYVMTNLGITETQQLDTRVVVYPNPTVDSFKLSIPSESLGEQTEVSIFDLNGKKVKSFKVSDSYDVQDLVNGLYFIKINDGVNLKVTKLIKK